MKIASQQLKDEMSKLTSIGGGIKLGISTVDFDHSEKKEGWAKFLNYISSKSHHEMFSNHLDLIKVITNYV